MLCIRGCVCVKLMNALEIKTTSIRCFWQQKKFEYYNINFWIVKKIFFFFLIDDVSPWKTERGPFRKIDKTKKNVK